MITIIIFAILGLIYVYYVYCSKLKYATVGTKIITYIISLLIVIQIAFLGLLLAMILPTKTITKVDTFYIVNQESNNSISIGTICINNHIDYVIYNKQNNTIVDATTKHSNTVKVERYRQEKVPNTFINLFTLSDSYLNDIKYIVYAPKGTIFKNNTIIIQ